MSAPKPRRPKGDGQISILPNGKAFARADFGFGRKSKTFANRPEAAAWLKEQERLAEIAKKEAETKKQDGPMLYAYLEEFIKRYKTMQVSRNTQDIYKYALKNITGDKKLKRQKEGEQPPAPFPCLANKPINQITSTDIQDFINALSATHSRSSIDKVNILLSQAYKQAIIDGIINTNPAANIKLPQKKSKKVRALTPEQQTKVEEIALEYANGDLIIFLLYTGLRVGEALNLTWHDINMENKECTIGSAKTEAGIRTIYLANTAYAILERRKEKNLKKEPGDYIFLNSSGNQIAHNVDRLCKTIGKKAGVGNFHAHMCRHCFATRLLEKNASMKAVSELLGHKSVQITFDIYSHVLPTLKQETINLLN